MALFSVRMLARSVSLKRWIASSVIWRAALPSCPPRLRSVSARAAMEALASASLVAKIRVAHAHHSLFDDLKQSAESRLHCNSLAATLSRSCSRRCFASSDRSRTSASSARNRSGAKMRRSRPRSTIASSASSRIDLLPHRSAPAVAFRLQTSPAQWRPDSSSPSGKPSCAVCSRTSVRGASVCSGLPRRQVISRRGR